MPLRAALRRLPELVRPRAPEPLPVRLDRRRIYVLPTRFGLYDFPEHGRAEIGRIACAVVEPCAFIGRKMPQLGAGEQRI